ncbi:glycosyltransferase, partial [Phenylobacterium sp.]|uniref:glycosyltransferase n=1 Tax=Phenylobacterium sp. TaxID=1871053 RepID=UPI002F406CDF
MRILYSFPHAIGAPGIGTTAIHQVSGLLARGHQVDVIAASVHPDAGTLPSVVRTMVVGGMRIPHRLFGWDRAVDYHDFRVATHLRRAGATYDVVHCWPGAVLKTSRAANDIGVPCVREVPNTHTAHACEVFTALCAVLDVEIPPGHSHRKNPQRLRKEEKEYLAAKFLLVPSEHV